MKQIDGQLKNYIDNGLIRQAIAKVKSKDYARGWVFVITVLHNKKSTPELVDVALTAFRNIPKYTNLRYRSWLNDLLKFHHILWQRQMYAWIKVFYGIFFIDTNKISGAIYSWYARQFIETFLRYVKFDDNPVEFGLTSKNLGLADCRLSRYSQARIEEGPFESKGVFLWWQLCQPEIYTSAEKIHSIVRQLGDLNGHLGVNTSEVRDIRKVALIEYLKRLEEDLVIAKESGLNCETERLIRIIKRNRAKLKM